MTGQSRHPLPGSGRPSGHSAGPVVFFRYVFAGGVAAGVPAVAVLVGSLVWDGLTPLQQVSLALAAAALFLALIAALALMHLQSRAAGTVSPDDEHRLLPAAHRHPALASPAPEPLFYTGPHLIEALRRDDPLTVEDALDSQLISDIDEPDPKTGMTLLHYAAAYNAEAIVKALGARDDVDFTVRDAQERTASALAFEIADNAELGAYLLRKEHAQHRARGETPSQ